MKYLKAEHIKFKRTVSNELLFIIPLMTAFFAWFVGGFYGFQYMTFYWWYAFLLPGTIAILCLLSHQREEKAGKYYSVLSAPINLKQFELAKAIILTEKLFIAATILSIFILLSNFISPALAVYSIERNVLGSFAIIIASFWQIPMCLFLARKVGMLLPVIANTLLGILSPIVFGNTVFVWVCPYCWPAKFGEIFMGINSNGTFSGHMSSSQTMFLPLLLSIFLYILFLFMDAENFSKMEGR